MGHKRPVSVVGVTTVGALTFLCTSSSAPGGLPHLSPHLSPHRRVRATRVTPMPRSHRPSLCVLPVVGVSARSNHRGAWIPPLQARSVIGNRTSRSEGLFHMAP